MSLKWIEHQDDDENDWYEAKSWLRGVSDQPCVWRLRQIVRANAIVWTAWYSSHELTLGMDNSRETWPTIEEAKAAIQHAEELTIDAYSESEW